MKKTALVFAFLASVPAFAGNTLCPGHTTLSCSSTYSIEHHEKLAGPAGSAVVTDIQPEPFDPADCEAAVVLYTEAGKFVATYLENTGTVGAWIDTDDGKEVSLLNDAPLTRSKPVSVTSVSYAPGSIDSVIFNCSLN